MKAKATIPVESPGGAASWFCSVAPEGYGAEIVREIASQSQTKEFICPLMNAAKG